LQYYEAQLCAHNVRNVAHFHAKNQILKRLSQLPVFEIADIPALRRCGPLGICSGKFSKHTAPPNGISDLLGLLLRRRDLRWLRLRDPNQNLAQPNLPGLTNWRNRRS
jgi:hypothetical protein